MTAYVNQAIVDCITNEIEQLENDVQELQTKAKLNNLDIRFSVDFQKRIKN
ncbi:hypothetical protein [Vibrio jasicida]|uniref:hypothetical protein n=1 Tax=Vibrio jasicida TaxID=766224 RepID=UPI000B0FDAB3|nr:hypothetical protein [Vibrio jasicida]